MEKIKINNKQNYIYALVPDLNKITYSSFIKRQLFSQQNYQRLNGYKI